MSDQDKKIFEVDERVDAYSREMFARLGYDSARLPDDLVDDFKTFKAFKDRLTPGRLSSEGFATIALFHEMRSRSVAE